LHPSFSDKDWGLITDRLYRRYLRQEDIEPASKLMDEIKAVFITITNDKIGLAKKEIQDISITTQLDINLPTLDLIFSSYFESFKNVVQSTIHIFNRYGTFKPIRLTLFNGKTNGKLEGMRPIKQYEVLSLTDDPFWLLPEKEMFKFLKPKPANTA